MAREKKNSDWDALQEILSEETQDASAQWDAETDAAASKKADQTDKKAKKTSKSKPDDAKKSNAARKKTKPSKGDASKLAQALACERDAAPTVVDEAVSVAAAALTRAAAQSQASPQNAESGAETEDAAKTPKKRRRPKPSLPEEAKEEERAFGDLIGQIARVAEAQQSEETPVAAKRKSKSKRAKTEVAAEEPVAAETSVEEVVVESPAAAPAESFDSETLAAKPSAVESTADDAFGAGFWETTESLDVSWGRPADRETKEEKEEEIAAREERETFADAVDESVDEHAAPIVEDANDATKASISVESVDFDRNDSIEAFFALDGEEDALTFSPRVDKKVDKKNVDKPRADKRAEKNETPRADAPRANEEKDEGRRDSESRRAKRREQRPLSEGAAEPERTESEVERLAPPRDVVSSPRRSRDSEDDAARETRDVGARRARADRDASSSDRGAASTERALPSWEQAISYVVERNLSQRNSRGKNK